MGTKITVLVENRAVGRDVLAEHGLSLWIEHDGHKILFDTGAGRAIRPNARARQIPLDEAEAVVLSHGHYDHTGGLIQVLELASPPVYAHPAAFQPKYKKYDDGRVVQINREKVNEEHIRRLGSEIRYTEQPTEIVEGLFATGPVPRETDFETTPDDFFLDEACTKLDTLVDDQSLYFFTEQGPIVLCGCAHSGVVNTLRYVQELTGQAPYGVFGGMHLLNSGPEVINMSIRAMQEMGVTLFGPSHCTGVGMTATLWTTVGDNFRDFCCGDVLDWC
ncbi:MAG: MBL fold metallo-hydrolase [Planctomycetia bacterium]|jgi:7,8-dihydropterin-6-yl-methyl-4-(beta-D-ribofuranosyl)aminobenzene 5'-phosphate synthase